MLYSNVDIVPCTTAEPQTRIEQLLATAWVQHLVPPRFQGNATQAAVVVFNALTDHDHGANTLCGNKYLDAISASCGKGGFLLTGVMFKAWSRVQVMGDVPNMVQYLILCVTCMREASVTWLDTAIIFMSVASQTNCA